MAKIFSYDFLQNLDNNNFCDEPVNQICYPCRCIKNMLTEPIIVATGTAKLVQGSLSHSRVNDNKLIELLYRQCVSSVNRVYYPKSYLFKFGQDILYESGKARRKIPFKKYPEAASTEDELKIAMWHLRKEYDDGTLSEKLFKAFLGKKNTLEYYEDDPLNKKISQHATTKEFIKFALSTTVKRPIRSGESKPRDGIHQALKKANWDISKIQRVDDLGPPAYHEWFGMADDDENGLTIMLNGIQHVVVVATNYYYDSCQKEYYIKLKFFFYDVFGLDDLDIKQYGLGGTESWPIVNDKDRTGFTAWWQLQHQYGYAPLITKITFEREYTIPAK